MDSLTTPTAVPRPSTSTSIPSIYDCTFEDDFCSWTHRTDGALNWTRNQGSTSTYETGPQFDVTTHSGRNKIIFCNKYFFIEFFLFYS